MTQSVNPLNNSKGALALHCGGPTAKPLIAKETLPFPEKTT